MITEFLQQYGLFGISLGLITFLIIGLFHPIVIKTEYYIGTKAWPVFLIAGIVLCVYSYIEQDIFLSTIAGVTAFSSFWSILELFEQKERVAKGWFPANPNKNQKQKTPR